MIKDLHIESRGFQILPIDKYFDLTTADRVYLQYPDTGGITVIPVLDINTNVSGQFYMTQVCHQHEMAITCDSGQVYNFNSFGEQLKDTSYPFDCHYRRFLIKNGAVYRESGLPDELVFHDYPFKELFSWWSKIYYYIDFQTFFQWSESEQPNVGIEPVLSFRWHLAASAIKTKEGWRLEDSDYNTVDQIKQSVVYNNPGDEPVIPCGLRHLKTTVQKFEESHAELRRNFAP